MVSAALIPACNEEKTIGEVSIMRKLGLVPLVIDDDSKDNTNKFAKGRGYCHKT